MLESEFVGGGGFECCLCVGIDGLGFRVGPRLNGCYLISSHLPVLGWLPAWYEASVTESTTDRRELSTLEVFGFVRRGPGALGSPRLVTSDSTFAVRVLTFPAYGCVMPISVGRRRMRECGRRAAGGRDPICGSTCVKPSECGNHGSCLPLRIHQRH